MTTTLYFKRLFSISLLNAAFVFAAASSFAEYPQPVSKDKERRAYYRAVTQGYLRG